MSTVLITGASRGIGLGLVSALLSRDDVTQVIAVCRRPDESDALQGLYNRWPNRLGLRAVDLRDEAAIERLPGTLECRALDLVVNAAGVLHGDGARPEKRIEHVGQKALLAAFSVNAFAPVLVAKALWPLLCQCCAVAPTQAGTRGHQCEFGPGKLDVFGEAGTMKRGFSPCGLGLIGLCF